MIELSADSALATRDCDGFDEFMCCGVDKLDGGLSKFVVSILCSFDENLDGDGVFLLLDLFEDGES